MPRKPLKVVDNVGTEIPCVTVIEAAKRLDMTVAELKLVMFRVGDLPYYKIMGKGKRKLYRIKIEDLKNYVKEKGMFDKIADKIIYARKRVKYVKEGMIQAELARETKISIAKINRIENKKERVGIKTLGKIAKACGKDLAWFLE
jgi:DNA-binding Xre family transcriptional regulator